MFKRIIFAVYTTGAIDKTEVRKWVKSLNEKMKVDYSFKRYKKGFTNFIYNTESEKGVLNANDLIKHLKAPPEYVHIDLIEISELHAVKNSIHS